MKRYVVLIIGVLFFCGSNPVYADHVVGFLIPVSGLGDESFNDMTYAGLIKAKNTHHFSLVREKCKGTSIVDQRIGMERLVQQRANVIVTNGWEFRRVVEEYAKKYPDVNFIINDIPVSGHSNISSTVFGQHEGAFLAGTLAGWMTKTSKIGFIGGKDMPVIRAFQTGFREGAVYARADITIMEVFLSGQGEKSQGFDNPGLAFKKADILYGQGVDIIFSVAGLAGNGVIRSAVKNQGFVIGVDADQDHMAKGHVLTSVMKRLDRAIFEVLGEVLRGDHTSGVFSFGLKEDGVALSPMTYTRHLISPQILENVEVVKDKIIKGEIIVTNYLESNIEKAK